MASLASGKWQTLEISPAKTASLTPTIEKIKELDIAPLVDGFVVTDNPLAKLKYGSLFASIRLQEAFKKPVLATLSMRDRNIIGLQSDLLGCNDANIRAFLAVTGDPATLSDQPHAKGVFEANSIELLKIMHYFNHGIDYAGKQISPAPQPILPFAVTNSYAKNAQTLKRKLIQKLENGAVGIISQPVFALEDAKNLLKIFDEAKSQFDDDRKNAKLIIGVFPLTRLKTAQFISSHVPGIKVPDRWISALFDANEISQEEEERIGFEMSCDLYKSLRSKNLPVHIMSANRFDVAKRLLLIIN